MCKIHRITCTDIAPLCEKCAKMSNNQPQISYKENANIHKTSNADDHKRPYNKHDHQIFIYFHSEIK